jgi:uncharacterized coiled-coil protein SlyX
MTTLESRFADYRQLIERLENAVARKNRQIDELLERLKPVEPKRMRVVVELAKAN